MPFVQMIADITIFGGIFSAVILTHEAGHYAAAKCCRVPVSEFSIGFPGTPVIARLLKSKETMFTLRLFPFGGFVRFEDGAIEELPPGSKAALIVAGSGCNLVTGVVMLVAAVMGYKGLDFVDACTDVLNMVAMVATESVRMLGNLNVSGIAGPVGMATLTHQVMAKGFWAMMGFTGLLSVSVGMMNLLPIPGFDGWHLVITGIETVMGRPMSRRFQCVAGVVGFTVVVVLMVMVTYRDILNVTR